MYQNEKADSVVNTEVTEVTEVNTSGFYQAKQTPFSVGLGLYIHKKTRSKELIDSLSQMHLCINYQKISRIETSIGNAVIDKIIENNGTYVPLSKLVIFFAVDNSEGKNESLNISQRSHDSCTKTLVNKAMTRVPKH